MDEDLKSRLLRLFVGELEEHLESLEHGLDQVADNGPPERGVVDDLFRSAHSLKGAAAAVGATAIASLCHQLEERLSLVRHGDLELTGSVADELLRLVDEVAAAAGELRARTVPPAGGDDADPAVALPSAAAPTGDRTLTTPEAVAAGRDATTVKLAGSRLDALLGLAGDLITSTYRGEGVVAGWAQLGERVAGEVDRSRRDRAEARRVLGASMADYPELLRTLERDEAAWRELATEVDRVTRTALAHQGTTRRLASGFAESLRHARLVTFTEATGGLARMVRDLSAEHGKQVTLAVDAAEVEVDQKLVATLHDVLGHAVRNALVHGIESPEERAARGKPATGRIAVAASLDPNGIAVSVADDGRGIDLERVQERAAALGLGARGDGRTDLTEALFHPGLSTATEVTEHAGRGVGLDAVRTAVESSGGTVSFDSSPGEGSMLSIRMPLTLSTLRVLFVRVAGERVALPTSAIRRAVRVPEERAYLAGHEVMETDDLAVPVVPLAQVLGWPESAPPDVERTGLLVPLSDSSVVLLVEELLAEREVVLQAGSPRLTGLTLLLGATQLEDGSACLVLSPSACARTALAVSPGREPTTEAERRPARVLLVEDTVTTRELERTILLGAGYDVVVAVDGQQAWEMLQGREFDAVVTDVNMPRMDGITLCRKIRDSRQYADLPVVLVTSLHDDRDRRRGLEAGADAYLTKQGFDRADLLEILERLL